MCKHAAIYVLSLIVLGFLALEAVLSDGSETEVLTVLASSSDRETAMKLAAHRRFRDVFEPAIQSLLQGRMALRDACDEVYQVARDDAPIYLQMLPQTDPGRTVREQIARNLLAHVQDHVDEVKLTPSPIPRLQAELRDIVAEMN